MKEAKKGPNPYSLTLWFLAEIIIFVGHMFFVDPFCRLYLDTPRSSKMAVPDL
jgi:hypothetical protein